MLGVVVALVLLASAVLSVWILAQHEILWCRIPANTFAFVVTGTKDPSDSSLISGGGIVEVLHEVPGKKLNRSSLNKFEWTFEDGHEEHGLLHFILGVQWIGFARSLRINHIRDRCFRRDDIKGIHSQSNDCKAKFIYYSREQAVEVNGANTLGSYRLDLPFNLLYAVIAPVRAILGMADSNAVLTMMISEKVSNVVGTQEPEYFLQGDAAIKDFSSML